MDPEYPETHLLGLPSDFPQSEHIRLGLESLVSIEIQLREGQANDALQALREDLRFEYSLRKQKQTHARGAGSNTRASTMLRNAGQKKMRSAQRYLTARNAMISLGCLEADSSFTERFPYLDTSKDLWMKDPTQLLNLGDGTRQESWIWRIGSRPNNAATTPWQIESKY